MHGRSILQTCLATTRRFHTVTTGGGRGKPLMLFLHGFPELWYSWRRQLEEFSDDYEVFGIPS